MSSRFGRRRRGGKVDETNVRRRGVFYMLEDDEQGQLRVKRDMISVSMH